MEQSILDLFKLNGKTAMIVGGNRGLGLAMAKALAEAGAGDPVDLDEEVVRAVRVGAVSCGHGIGLLVGMGECDQTTVVRPSCWTSRTTTNSAGTLGARPTSVTTRPAPRSSGGLVVASHRT